MAGVRVVDFCWVTAGPMATRNLADFGAEVIKLESRTRVDLVRGYPPLSEGKTGLNVSGPFNNYNRNKLGITLNIGHPRGRDIVKRLVSISDVVSDNFTPGTMSKWGFDYERLREIKPDIIVLSMPVMGNNGPRRSFGGYGMGIAAAAGITYITGSPRRMPVGIGTAYPDAGPNPRHAAIAVLAALHYRNRTGKGQHIELAQYESTICFTGTAVLDYTVNQRVQSRMGNRLPYAAPHGAYRCKGDERWCVIAVFNEEEWRSFCQVIGNPPWTTEEKFATLLRRKENEDELDHLVEEWTRQRTAEEVMMSMQRAGVAAGVVQNGQDLLEKDEQLRFRGHYVYMEHPEAGRIAHDNVPCKLSATPGVLRRPAPILGQDNEYVYGDLLGMTEDEMNQCYVDGVFD